MKKVILLCSMVVISLTLSAQNKKEMQASIENLQTNVESLQTMVNNQTKTIETLQTELNQTKSSLMLLQQNLLTQQQAISDLQARQTATTNSATAIITRQDSVADFFVRYCAVEDWQDRLPMVMEPKNVKTLMKQYYDANGYGAQTLKYDDIKNRVKKVKNNLYLVNDWCFIVVTPDGFKVDWKGSYMRYMSNATAIKESSVGTTGTLWVKLRIGNSFDGGYHCYPMQCAGSENGYVKIGTALDKKLQTMLQNGIGKMVIVKVRTIQEDRGNHKLEITELVSESWSQY